MANGIVLNIDTTKSEFQNPMVQLRQGDGNYQSLAVTVTSNGEPFDLTGWTTTFMGTTAGGFKIVDSAITVTNALQGEFTYTPTKAWGQNQGEFKNAYFKFTKAEETASGASFRVNVLDAVNLTAAEAGDYISVVDVMIDKIKTDMDNKLADTQKTLTNTQNQANTVQSNVNDLNTNVNELKAQNNNIKTSDNTFTGSNTFTQLIKGSLSIKYNNFTKFSDVIKNMSKYTGYHSSGSDYITDMPYQGWAIIHVQPYGDFGQNSGMITLIYTSENKTVHGHVNNGEIFWELSADDKNVVHNTGTETIAGDKTWTGTNTFNKKIIATAGVQGNADTATKLQTPRKLKVNLASTADQTFDGSADQVGIGISGVLPIGNGGTGGSSRVGAINNLAYIGLNPITGIADDTPDKWVSLGTGVFRINTLGLLNIQPGQYLVGYQFVVGNDVTQTISAMPDGGTYVRKGNIQLGWWGANNTTKPWDKLTVDDTVIHNTGTETVAGDKTFTGNTNFSGQTTLKTGNYGLRVTTSGVQKTSDGGITWVNV